MFREPTKAELQAAAGWTLAKRQSTTPEHVVALDHYRDGCEALMPFAPAAGDGVGSREAPVAAPQPQVAKDRLAERIVAQPAKVTAEFAALAGVKPCQDGGVHRFNIHTQRCVFCDQTRRQALGREPELMVR